MHYFIVAQMTKANPMSDEARVPIFMTESKEKLHPLLVRVKEALIVDLVCPWGAEDDWGAIVS